MKVVLFVFGCLFTFSLYAQFSVGTTTITFNDPGRTGGFGSGGGPGRQIQTEVYYPAASAGTNVPVATGDFPVIVFGHGFAMAWDSYDNFWTRYAAQGYILAFPRTEGNLSPSHNDFGLDLRLVAERMNLLNTELSSLFYDKLNGKTAIMGHSMGGGSTYLAAANNSSITTVVTFAGAETDPSAIAAAANVTVPAVVMYGSKDGVTPPAEHSIPLYNALGSARKTLVNIVDGNHCRFANANGNCETAELLVSPFGAISRANHHLRMFTVLDPWLAYMLKGGCAAYGTFLNVITATPATISSQTTCVPNPDASITYDEGVLSGSITGANGQWQLNGTAINGATNQTHVPLESGNYTWVVTFLDGCQSTSNTINVDLCQGLSAPGIQVAGNVLSVDAGWDSYQWYLNGSPISGANGASYTATTDGVYHVVVSTAANCDYQSDSYLYESGGNSASLLEWSSAQVTCYPNPVTDVLHITWEGMSPSMDVVVLNAIGQVVISQNISTTIDFSEMESGIYFVILGEYTLKIIRQ
jgi:dienelactone hydrolase